jgi:biotin carboxyl carrier protein
MNYRSGIMTGVAATLLLTGTAAAGWWLYTKKPGEANKPSHPAVPATVPKPFKEDQAYALTLTPDAEARLAVQLGKVERRHLRRYREYGGEVAVPTGRSVIVSAPLAGTLRTAGLIPTPGLVVTRGQPVFQLLPILDPVGRANLTAMKVDADGQVKSADEQFKAAEIAFQRAKKVLEGGAGRQRDVDETHAALEVATKTKEAAVARQSLLQKVLGEFDAGSGSAITIDAPESGMIRSVSALAGQNVPAGAALFEVIDLDQIWVRVPVYVGDMPETDTTRPVAIGCLTGGPGLPSRPGSLVPAPPVANPAVGTVDLFYSTVNWKIDDPRWAAAEAVTGFGTIGFDRAQYRPGERVGVSIPLRDSGENLTVPWSAVVFDIQGGTWVYERTGERSYTRRRVVVKFVSEGYGVLSSGPPVGTQVVTVGAAELLGAEAGYSK